MKKEIVIPGDKTVVEAFLAGNITVMFFDWSDGQIKKISKGDHIELFDTSSKAKRKSLGILDIVSCGKLQLEQFDVLDYARAGCPERADVKAKFFETLSGFKKNVARLEFSVMEQSDSIGADEEPSEGWYFVFKGNMYEWFGLAPDGELMGEAIQGGVDPSTVCIPKGDVEKWVKPGGKSEDPDLPKPKLREDLITVDSLSEKNAELQDQVKALTDKLKLANEKDSRNSSDEVQGLKQSLSDSAKIIEDLKASAIMTGSKVMVDLTPYIEILKRNTSDDNSNAHELAAHYRDTLEILFQKIAAVACRTWAWGEGRKNQFEEDVDVKVDLGIKTSISFDALNVVVIGAGEHEMKVSAKTDEGSDTESRKIKFKSSTRDVTQTEFFAQDTSKEGVVLVTIDDSEHDKFDLIGHVFEPIKEKGCVFESESFRCEKYTLEESDRDSGAVTVFGVNIKKGSKPEYCELGASAVVWMAKPVSEDEPEPAPELELDISEVVKFLREVEGKDIGIENIEKLAAKKMNQVFDFVQNRIDVTGGADIRKKRMPKFLQEYPNIPPISEKKSEPLPEPLPSTDENGQDSATEVDPFDAGVECARAGGERSKCPHETGTYEHEMWLEGFDATHEEELKSNNSQ